jgi:hypothetical protein
MLKLHRPRPPADPPPQPRRRISPERVAWARYCDQVLVEHGAVRGTMVYSERHRARWQGRALVSLLVELQLHDRSELRGHTDRVKDGWIWTVEYLGARGPRT